MTPERITKFKEVVRNRQANLTVVLENVHDHHNIGAVLRTCDSIGVKEVFVLYTEPELDREHLTVGARASSGARKWITINFFTDRKACFDRIQRDYDKIYGTHLSKDSKTLYELDLAESVALVFGNEHKGISEEALSYCDGNFLIPQVGMVQSLNISVACAVSLYEAFRQRSLKGFYSNRPTLSDAEQDILLADYINRHEKRIKNKTVKRLND